MREDKRDKRHSYNQDWVSGGMACKHIDASVVKGVYLIIADCLSQVEGGCEHSHSKYRNKFAQF